MADTNLLPEGVYLDLNRSTDAPNARYLIIPGKKQVYRVDTDGTRHLSLNPWTTDWILNICEKICTGKSATESTPQAPAQRRKRDQPSP